MVVAPAVDRRPALALEDASPGSAHDEKQEDNGQKSAPKASIAEMIAHLQGARQGQRPQGAPKAKTQTKGKAGAKVCKTTKKEKTQAKAKVCKPTQKGCDKPKSVHVERSVSHVLARTGKSCYPKSKAFPYKTPAGIAHAKKLAWKWLREVCP